MNKTAIVLMILVSSWLFASDEPVFFIEKIRIVDAAFISHDVIISESNLKTDRAYSEKELRNAIDRINRLPFILDTRFSLEKGSEKGKYHLVVTVKAAARLFFNLETLRSERQSYKAWFDDLDLGYRWSVGSSGIMFAAVSPDISWLQESGSPETISLGYSQYNLFNRNIFFNITINWVNDTVFTLAQSNGSVQFSSFRSPITPEMSLYAPIRGNHWLKLESSRQDTRSSGIFDFNDDPINVDSREDEFNVRLYWENNTLNDHFLPRDGKLAQAGLWYANRDSFSTNTQDAEITSYNRKEVYNFFWAAYKRYHPITARQSWHYRGEIGYGSHSLDITGLRHDGDFITLDQDDMEGFGVLEIGYALDLWNRKKTAKYGNLRFEARANVGQNRYLNFFRENDDELGLSCSIVFRNKWGVIRVGYNHYGGEL